jgi:hypothetical protein
MIKRAPKGKKNPYAKITNKLLRDKNISWKAKGIISYLLSNADGWKLYASDIINNGREGKKAVYSALQELMKFGYLQRKIIRKGNLIKNYLYIINEEPIKKNLTLSKVVKQNIAKQKAIVKKKLIKKISVLPKVVNSKAINPKAGNCKTDTNNTNLKNINLNKEKLKNFLDKNLKKTSFNKSYNKFADIDIEAFNISLQKILNININKDVKYRSLANQFNLSLEELKENLIL